MSTPILPFAVWAPGTNQNSIPANDNSLRWNILNGLILGTANDESTPANGDIYIVGSAPTGAYATFDENDLAIYYSGTWYAYAPVEGIRINDQGTLKRWDGADYIDIATSAAVAVPIGIAVSDETTALTTGAAKVTFRMPYAMTLTGVRASVTTAPTGAALQVDINVTGSGSILSTPITIDATEKTSTTAATPPVISDTTLDDDAEITIDIDQIGSTIAGAGLKVWLIGNKTP